MIVAGGLATVTAPFIGKVQPPAEALRAQPESGQPSHSKIVGTSLLP